ncbi:acetyl-CoA carboxylase biotin carboxyl carrier protein [Variovorax sp. PBL-E5]|uniref:acetyl-CoA carboxylase biotin carboxyl carrier protein n=1 Tax=Variovorax sp. PBL-E5 TaxID=434014 RepID=UPI0013178D9D|nr:acetyl-CoA carboxylase biotin carboxyl carrier protein subunit [Variovorax sp. PBL-E5]VTU31804.1 acetyl-CoA carboxylase, biotin carboxyl carrier protein [Variovorax sp. PBL-E5]
MKTPAELEQLTAWLAQTDIGLLELRMPGGTVRLDNPRATARAVAPGTVIAASSVGVFLHAHPLAEAPLVRAGERVRAGQPVGLLRIGPLLLPVAALRDGVVAAMRAADGTPVGYGTALVELQAP